MRIILLISLVLLINSKKILNPLQKARVGDKIQLPAPERDGGIGLYDALTLRRSQRDFVDSHPATLEMLSQALWSCYGINRENTKQLTTPSGKAWYPLSIYVFIKEGVFLYNRFDNSLETIVEGDYRAVAGTQAYVAKATANFVMVANYKKKSQMDPDQEQKFRNLYLESGHCAMNLGLYTAANNLKGVPRAMVDNNAVLRLLNLDSTEYIVSLAYSMGH